MNRMRIRPFRDGDAYATFQNLRDTTVREIEGLENDYVLKASPTELEQYYLDKVTVTPLSLDAAGYYIENQEGTQIDVTGDFGRATFGPGPHYVKGTALGIAVPYTGDPQLWRLRASTYSLSGYPELEVRGDVVVFSCRFPDDSPEPERLKNEIERTVQSLKEAIGHLAGNVANHNREAAGIIKTALQRKLQKAQAAVNTVAGLGIPIPQRSQPQTFAIPARRRESPVRRPAVPTEKFSPEPTLEQKEYERIIGILKSMALVIERSPGSFASLDEEAIRTHFLLQLNGHYEGAASGETFNAAGKTDILIRVDNRNVFIAECKFWRGPKSFSEAVDQLLNYLSWRDSKCALLIFNPTKESSAVREKMHEVMTARGEHRKTVMHDPNGDSRYVFVKSSDPGREVQIHTMLFDMPRQDAS
jgi:hypothetical protein